MTKTLTGLSHAARLIDRTGDRSVALALPAFAQEGPRDFDWAPANNETVRLDPAFYHAGRTNDPGADGGHLHVEIQAQQPGTIFMVAADECNHAPQNPRSCPSCTQSV